MNEKVAHINKVDVYDIGNGPGVGVVVWYQGCPHVKICGADHCHNPETHDWNLGIELTDDRIEKIINACDKPHITRLTLSGGDPLHPFNRDGAYKLVKRFRQRFSDTKSVWLWTGYLYEQIEHLSIIDLVDTLIDGPFDYKLYSPKLQYRGSSNQRVITIHHCPDRQINVSYPLQM